MRGAVDSVDLLGPFREPAGERARATADVEHLLEAVRQGAEHPAVVPGVVVPVEVERHPPTLTPVDAREANRRTLAGYETHADRYLADRGTAPAELHELYDRLAELAPGGTVLELGSGPGACALELEARGLRVRRTDATVAFVDLAALLQRATLAAEWLAFTVKEGDGDVWTTQKLDVPRWFVYWREPALRALLDVAGWSVVSVRHHHGRHDDWLTVLARRR